MTQPPLKISDQPLRDGRIAIIDIGSNSIRFVVYDQQKRAPVAIYNEKVMCALGKGLATSGMLNPAGVEMAKATLRRFIALGRNMEITSMHVMATAAVRDASDGEDFARALEREYEIDIDIISGKKEARLGAHGICASMYRPKGISGDLGGGSLELVKINDGHIGEHASLLLGSLRMIDETKGDRAKLHKLVEKRFAELKWLDDRKADNFYAIGGSFRALAKMHMLASNYPLHILHDYKAEAKSFLCFVRELINLPNDKLEKIPGMAKNRIPALPGAAIVLEHIIEHTRADYIVFSSSGIREGYLYEKLSPFIREQDGLISSCTEFATKSGRTTDYASELYKWMSPLIGKETEKERRLRMAFSLLSDIALHIHPEHRAEWAFHRILHSALTVITHRERVKLSLALYHRYQFKRTEEWPALTLLKASDHEWARMIGASANLAHHLTGGIAGSLQHCAFKTEKSSVVLEIGAAMQDIIGDAIKRRMDNLREAYSEYIS